MLACYSGAVKEKSIAVFDIDKTLSKDFLIVPIMYAEEEAGFLPTGTFNGVTKILTSVKNGQIAYEDAAHQLLEVHATGLRGRQVDSLYEYSRIFLNLHGDLFRRFSAEVISLLSPTHELMAVTAEPEYMARAVVESLGMDSILSSQYEVVGGQFTGRVSRSLAHRDNKRELLGGLRPNFAFGDSSGDIEMLSRARYAFCIAPDDELASRAQHHGWDVFNGDEDVPMIMQSVTRYLENIS